MNCGAKSNVPAERRFGRQRDAQAPHVGADLEAVAADQLGQRAVDRVRALPANRTGAPAADVLGALVEGEGREDIGAAGTSALVYVGLKPSDCNPGGKRLACRTSPATSSSRSAA